jgi:DNA polymerase-1
MLKTPSKMSVNSLFASAQIQQIEEAAIVMERNGFMIDTEYCQNGLSLCLRDESSCLVGLAQSVGASGVPPLPGIDNVWTSHPQLTTLLERHLKLPPSPFKVKGKVNLAAGERSTDKRALEWILGRTTDPSHRAILEGISSLRKIRNCAKYFGKLPNFIASDGFIHPVCGPAGDDDDRVGAITGRFGMKNPEGQQIPRDKKKDKYRIRRAFIAPPGWKLIAADYSALEVVLLANIAEWLFGDTQLLEMTAPGFDIHSYNAHRVFGVFLNWKDDNGRPLKDCTDLGAWKADPILSYYRDLVKEVWYGLMYGKSDYGFGMSLKGRDGEAIGQSRAGEIRTALLESVPSLSKYQSWVAAWGREFLGIPALDGRFLDTTELRERGEWGVKAAERAEDNYPMQAGGAGVVGAAMCKVVSCDILEALETRLQLQVHDEFVFRAPADCCEMAVPVIRDHMVNAVPLKNLQVSIKIGNTWEECK